VPDFTCDVEDITIDETIYQRAEIRQDIVDDLVALIDNAGSDVWPFATRVQVCRIGTKLFVTDGAHRVEACRVRKLRVDVSMKTVTREEAVLEGIKANGTHGAKRSAADTRKAVYSAAMLFPDMSNQVIANHMSVTAETVRKYRSELDIEQPEKRKGIDGVERSAKKNNRKKKSTASEAGSEPNSSQAQEEEKVVVREEPVVVAPVEPEVRLTVEQKYEQQWLQLIAGLKEKEVAELTEWVADFHRLVMPAKRDTLFPVEKERDVSIRRRRKPTEMEFEQFWNVYPRKTNKLKAKTAMDKAFRLLTSTLEPDQVMDKLVSAAKLYRDRCNPDPEYQMHPSSWLNAGRWEDAPDSIGKKKDGGSWQYGMFTEE
jgi:hypothetical protein